MSGDAEYYYNGEYVTIYGRVEGEDDWVITRNDHQDMSVARESELVLKENSYAYRRATERTEELQEITAEAEKNLKEMADKLVDEALKRLAARIRINAMFGEPSNATFGLTISKELETMVREQAPKKLKKKDIFS